MSTAMERLNPIVREVGLQRQDAWRTKERRIYDHEFFYCAHGQANMTIEKQAFILTPGKVGIVPPDTAHLFWSEETTPASVYWFHCDFTASDDGDWLYGCYNTPERYARLFSGPLEHREHIRPTLVLEQGFCLPAVVTLEDAVEGESIFRTLLRTYVQGDARFPIHSKTLVLRLLSLVLSSSGYYDAVGGRTRVADTIHHAIKANYYRRVSVSTLCEGTGLNPDYAGKLFKQETGRTMVEALNESRVQHAKKLLLDQDLTLSDVAEMVGFQNETYFSLVVKSVTGQTPARLRRQLRALMEPE